MQDKLRKYIDSLFEEAPPTKKAVELKEEILQNLSDKYNDLIAEGKTEEAAYNIAVASIGDLSELIENLKGSAYQVKDYPPDLVMRSRQRSALLTSISVALYILCVVPVIFIDDEIGILVMFSMIAVATGMLIYNNMTKLRYVKADDTIVEEFKEWKQNNYGKNQSLSAVKGAIWSIAVAVYIIVSFMTMAWHITWVIFLIAGAVQNIVKAAFELRK